jgi:hypothetical protein
MMERTELLEALLLEAVARLEDLDDQGADDGDGRFDTWKSAELVDLCARIRTALAPPAPTEPKWPSGTAYQVGDTFVGTDGSINRILVAGSTKAGRGQIVKASALIEQLHAAIAEHGDLEVYAPDGMFACYGPENVEPVTGVVPVVVNLTGTRPAAPGERTALQLLAE